MAHKSMLPKKSAPPGLETDGKGNVIPVAKRTQADRRKVARAGARKKKKKS